MRRGEREGDWNVAREICQIAMDEMWWRSAGWAVLILRGCFL